MIPMQWPAAHWSPQPCGFPTCLLSLGGIWSCRWPAMCHNVSLLCLFSDQWAAATAGSDLGNKLLHLLLLLWTSTRGSEWAGGSCPSAPSPHRGCGHLHRGRAAAGLGAGTRRAGHADRASQRGAARDTAHSAAPGAAAGHGHPGPGHPRHPRHSPTPDLHPLTQNSASAGTEPATAAHHTLPE